MAITNPGAGDKLDAALAIAQQHIFSKSSGTMKGAGTFQSLWRASGIPVAGVIPPVGAGAIPNRLTSGAVPLTSLGANTGYLANFVGISSSSGSLCIGDRLYHLSGLNSNVTTLQTINSSNIARNITAPNLLFIEHYAATPATASNITINYTNLENVAKTVTVPMVTTAVLGQLVPVPILDTGVKSIQSVQLSVALGSFVDFGLTIVNPIEFLPIALTNIATRLGVYDMALPVIDPDACLFLYWSANGTTSVQINGKLSIAQG